MQVSRLPEKGEHVNILSHLSKEYFNNGKNPHGDNDRVTIHSRPIQCQSQWGQSSVKRKPPLTRIKVFTHSRPILINPSGGNLVGLEFAPALA